MRSSARASLVAAAFAFVGALAIAPDASAFCRTHTGKIPPDLSVGTCFDTANYGAQAGLPLFWKNTCVGYSLSNHISSQVALDDVTAIAGRAFGRWTGTSCSTDGTTGSRVSIDARNLGPVDCNTNTYVSGKANQHVIFFSDNAWPYGDATNTLGKTFVTFNSDTGEIYDADMAINTFQYMVVTSDMPKPMQYDLESIITHEAGHFLGLAHSDNHQAVMYPTYNPGSTNLRYLTPDDIDGICSIYHPDGERTVLDDNGDKVTPGDTCDPTPRGGFASQCPTPGGSSCALSPGNSPSSSAALFALGALSIALGRRATRRRAD